MIRTKSASNQTRTKTRNIEKSPYYGKPPKPFLPGNKAAVGHGRPKTRMLTKELIKQLEEIKNRQGKTGTQQFIEAIVKKAKGHSPGNAALASLIYERIEGRLVQEIAPVGAFTHVNIDLSKLTEEQLEFAESLGLTIQRQSNLPDEEDG